MIAMKADGVFNRYLLMILLCIFVWVNLECGLAQDQPEPRALLMNRPSTEIREQGWIKDDDGSFSSAGAGKAGYNASCGEEDFNLSFKLRKLRGEMDVNININGSNYYSIRFTNISSPTRRPDDTTVLSTSISKHIGGATPSTLEGNATQYIPNQEYQISIISNDSHIQVFIERIESPTITTAVMLVGAPTEDAPMDETPPETPIETELTAAEEAPASETIVARMPDIQPVIDYRDPKPLPPGRIDFETLGGAYVEIYDVILTCMPNQLPTVTSLIQDPTSLMVNRQVGWTASAYDPEGDDVYYSFWLIGPSTDGWKLQQNWSTTHNRWEWRPSEAGFYRIGVYAGDDNHAPEDICDSNVSWMDDVVYVEQEPPKLGNEPVFERADPDNLVYGTRIWGTDWGPVPPNHTLIVVDEKFKGSKARAVADRLARNLSGTVKGQYDYVNMFQIVTNSSTREELIEDISYARNFSGVRLAFPNQQMYRESSGGDLSPSYEVVGVQDAWDIMDAYRDEPGFDLIDVTVGITDDGIYNWSGCEEFNRVCINTSLSEFPFGSAWLDEPFDNYSISGSHGTGIMNILAADPDDVGLTGIASKALQEKLKIYMINIFWQHPDFIEGIDFTTESLKGLHYEITNGSTILSCSWGTGHPDPQMAEMYRQFFHNVNEQPNCSKILFVCSAGNDGRDFSAEDYTHVPGGMKDFDYDEMTNMITVGNIMNNRSIAPNSNKNSDKFEVTISAPGEEAFWGRNSSGSIQGMGGGTSMATPHVTAAAAMIRSINPELTAAQIKGILKDSAFLKDSTFNGILSIDRSLELTIYRYLPSKEIIIQDPPRSLPPINSSGSSATGHPEDDQIVVPEDDGTVTNWTLNLEMDGGDLKLDLSQNGASISGRGVLIVASEDQYDIFTSPRSECPGDRMFNDIVEEFFDDSSQTISQLPMEASGSYDGINLILSMISLNDNVRYELELTRSLTTGSPMRGIYGISGTYVSYDSWGMPRSSGKCFGTFELNDPQMTATIGS